MQYLKGSIFACLRAFALWLLGNVSCLNAGRGGSGGACSEGSTSRGAGAAGGADGAAGGAQGPHLVRQVQFIPDITSESPNGNMQTERECR